LYKIVALEMPDCCANVRYIVGNKQLSLILPELSVE